MPFLHLDAENHHKPQWIELVRDHPAEFEVLEWSATQDRDLVQRGFPQLDLQLFPRSCVSITAALFKLWCYGGIVVRGQTTLPVRGLQILLQDWRTLGPPLKFTVRGFAYPIHIDSTMIMVSQSGDAVCRQYLDTVVKTLESLVWKHPVFGKDVGIM